MLKPLILSVFSGRFKQYIVKMGCASSKPQVSQPSPSSVPSSVTPSNKQTGHEKSVRFADQPTEISDKQNFEDKPTHTTGGHSLGVLQDVVEDGAPAASVAVAQTVKVEEVKAHKHEEAPVAPVTAVHTVQHESAPVHVPEPVVEHTSHHENKNDTKADHHHEHQPPHHEEVKHDHPSESPASPPSAHQETVAAPTTSEPVHVAAATPVAAAPVVAAPVAATVAPVAPAAVPAPQENKVPDLKKGYILKQGHLVKNWKNRFFILEEGLLTYYESSTANAPYGVNKKGEMSMKDVTVTDSKTLVTLSTRNKNGADLVLEIKYPNEREEWMAAFRQHAAWLKTTAR